MPVDAPSGTAYLRIGGIGEPQELHYAEVDGLAVFQGDIVLGKVSDLWHAPGKVHSQGVSVTGVGFRWPGAIVPFTIAANLPTQARVTDAIRHWEQRTNVQFIRRTPDNMQDYPDFITFQPHATACNSSVGRIGGQQFVNLAGGCGTGSTIHEIGHALGLWHEQSREDRDGFVTILWDNIDTSNPNTIHNFDQHITDADDLGEYDYGSIMHYAATDFGRVAPGGGLLTTIQVLDADEEIGQRIGLSARDIQSVSTLYPTPAPAAYLVGDVNLNGRADLLRLWTGGVDTFLAAGNGTYSIAREDWKPTPNYAMDLTWTRWLTADVNNDGRADLLHLWSGGINTLLAVGNGTYTLALGGFKPTPNYVMDVHGTRWLTADVNNDGRADLLHLWSGGINTLLAAGNGTYTLALGGFKPTPSYVMDAAWTQWLTADVNNDGRADLLHLWSGGINTLLAVGNGTYTLALGGFKPTPNYDMDVHGTRWLTADVNNDGRADLLHLWSGGINTLLAVGNGTYTLVAEGSKL